MMASLIIKVLTCPCCQLMTVLWVRYVRQHNPHWSWSSERWSGLPRSQEGLFLCKTRSSKVRTPELGTFAFKCQFWQVLAMWLTLETPVIAHSYALALIHAGNAVQLLTASTCIYVAPEPACPLPQQSRSDRDLGSLGAASSKTDWNWWKIPAPMSLMWDDSETWVYWLLAE